MAGDWIPFDHDFPEKPEVLAIFSATKAPIGEIMLRLHRFWRTVDRQTEDGHLPDVGPDVLPELCGGNAKFWEAVRAVGWLGVADDGHVFMPGFVERFGKSARVRMVDAKRKRADRNRTQRRTESGRATGQNLDAQPDTTWTESGHNSDALARGRAPEPEPHRFSPNGENQGAPRTLDFSRISIPPKLDFPEVRELLMRWHEARVKKHGPDLDPEMAITIALPMFPSAQHLEYNLRRAASGAWKTLACREEPPAHDTQSEHRATFRRRNPGPPATTGS